MASPTAKPPPVVGPSRWGDGILIVSGALAGFGGVAHLIRDYCLLPGTMFRAETAGSIVSFFSPFAYYPLLLLAASLSIVGMWPLFLWRRFAVTGRADDAIGRAAAPVTLPVLVKATAFVLGLLLIFLYFGRIHWRTRIDWWLWDIQAMFGS